MKVEDEGVQWKTQSEGERVSNNGFAQFQGGTKLLVSIIACGGLVVHMP